jgi:predicted RNase H-like nuclease (RuvC/YqgF family)
MEISEEDMQRLGRNVNALLTEIKELRAEIEELKLDSYRYKFVRSTCATTAEQIAGYDKSVDEHIRRRNENLN